MSTTAISLPNAERQFYSRMAIFMIAIVFIGFAPSFYLHGLVTVPRPKPILSPFVIFHGVVFTLWMLIFLTQTRLVAAGRRDLHMKLGIAAMLFAVMLVPVMYLTAVGEVARANQPPWATPLGWTAIALFPIPVFMLLMALGWQQRRNPQVHKRLMLGAALMMMDPAIGRFPILPPSFIGQFIFAGITLLTFVPLFIWDRKTLGHFHWATLLSSGLFAAVLVLRMFAIVSPAWANFVATLPGV
jgi:hypothetical protein